MFLIGTHLQVIPTLMFCVNLVQVQRRWPGHLHTSYSTTIDWLSCFVVDDHLHTLISPLHSPSWLWHWSVARIFFAAWADLFLVIIGVYIYIYLLWWWQICANKILTFSFNCWWCGELQWAATCGVCFSLTQILQVIVLLSTGGANGGGYILSKYALIGLQAVILLSLGILNCLPVQYFAYLSSFSMIWNALGKMIIPNQSGSSQTFRVSVLGWTEGTRIVLWDNLFRDGLVTTTFFSKTIPAGIIVVKWWKSIIAGVVILTILIPMVAVERQTTTYIFTSFYKPEGLGITSSPYIFFLGLLMSQYSLAGFDASAHMVRISQHHHHLLISSAHSFFTLTWSLSVHNPSTITTSDSFLQIPMLYETTPRQVSRMC